MATVGEEMQRIKAGTSLKAYSEDKLQRAKGGNRYVCPFCHSGGHGNAGSDSAFNVKGGKFSCFSCGKSGDIFDLAAEVEGIDPADKRGQLEAVAAWAGIPLSMDPSRPSPARPRAQERKQVAAPAPVGDKLGTAQGRDKHRAYIAQARESIDDPEAVAYLKSRGYTLEEAREIGLGYDPATKRLVIPWKGSDVYHIDRDVTGRASHKYSKPKTEEAGVQPLWNPAALESEAFFVVEGPFDALAVELAGFPAVALGGVGYRGILAALQGGTDKPTAIIALDRDETGTRECRRIAEVFQEAHIPYRLMEWEGVEGKDPDEMRRTSLEAFRSNLSRVHSEEVTKRETERERAYTAALARLRVIPAADVAMQLFTMDGAPELTPTGFPSFDKELGGGLPAGLVTLGAISSLGKTTLAVQMADQIAESGRGALFVTIEQSARELAAKSLSRLTETSPGGNEFAASAAEIATPSKRKWFSERKTARLLQACEIYQATIAPHLHIMEGVEQPAVADVAALAARIAEHDGASPVVFIDYLQLLRPASDRDSDKQAMDKNVMALRQLARELQTPVVVISSLNRASYSTGVTLESFKESGAIEYGSDVLLGLQPRNMGRDLADLDEKKAKAKARAIVTKHKAETVKDAELIILKNRNGGITDEGLPFRFDALHCLWEENPRKAKARAIENAL